MKGLYVKDFRLFWAQKSYYLVLIALAVGTAYFSANVALVFTFLCVVIPMFTLSSISYDQFDNGNAFLFSLPITRRSYVLEKYAFALSLEGIALLLSGILAIAISAVTDNGADIAGALSDLLVIIPIMGALVLILLSFMIPVNLKYGAEKGRVVLIIVVGVVVAVVLLVEYLVEMIGGTPAGIASLVEQLERMGMGVLVLAALALAAGVCAVSAGVSLRIIQKKEY